MAVAGARVELQRKDLAALHNRSTIDGEKNVPGLDPGAMRGRTGRDFGCHDPGIALDPQHAVLDLVGRRALDDIRNRHRQKQQGGGDRHDRPRPIPPTGRRLRTKRKRRVDHQTGPGRNCKLSKRHTTATSGRRMVSN